MAVGQLRDDNGPIQMKVFEAFQFRPTNDASAPGSTSMFKRIAAIAFIFLCTTVAWAVLGTTIFIGGSCGIDLGRAAESVAAGSRLR